MALLITVALVSSVAAGAHEAKRDASAEAVVQSTTADEMRMRHAVIGTRLSP